MVPEGQAEAYDYQKASEDIADSLDLQVAVGNSAVDTVDDRNVVHLAKDAVNKLVAVQLELVEHKFASLQDEIAEVHMNSEAVEDLEEVLDLGVDPKEVGTHLEQDLVIVVAEAEKTFERVVVLAVTADEATDVEVGEEADGKDVVADEKDEDSDVQVGAETDEAADVVIDVRADEEADGLDNQRVQVLEEGSFHPGMAEEVRRWQDKSAWKLMAC